MPTMKPLALVACAWLAGCVPLGNNTPDAAAGCPAIACGPSYQIDFQRPGGWPAGTYRVEVSAEGTTNSCEIVIPMSCDRPPRCQGNPTWLPIASGCALDPGQQKIDGVVFDRTTPASVAVTVAMGDRSLGMRTFTPTYRTTPLAPGCSLSCTQAQNEVMTLAQ
jgi:hypothetical protein